MTEYYAMLESSLQNHLDKTINVTAEQREMAESRFRDAIPNPVLQVGPDGVAVISILGVLQRHRANALHRLLGIACTSYIDIATATKQALADESVTSIKLMVNSPGGQIDGLDECFQNLKALSAVKPLTAHVVGTCASAAYWLACAADTIVSNSPSNSVGSIGVLATLVSTKGLQERIGIREITIVSRNAPKKNPDPESETGHDAIQRHIDALERIFHNRVANGRGVSLETVKENFGKGWSPCLI